MLVAKYWVRNYTIRVRDADNLLSAHLVITGNQCQLSALDGTQRLCVPLTRYAAANLLRLWRKAGLTIRRGL